MTVEGSITYTTDLCPAPGNEHEVRYEVTINAYGKTAYTHDVETVSIQYKHLNDAERAAIRQLMWDDLYANGYIQEWKETP